MASLLPMKRFVTRDISMSELVLKGTETRSIIARATETDSLKHFVITTGVHIALEMFTGWAMISKPKSVRDIIIDGE